MSEPIEYRGWNISYMPGWGGPKPGQNWGYIHRDWCGTHEEPDPRHGYAESLLAAKAAVDEFEDDKEA